MNSKQIKNSNIALLLDFMLTKISELETRIDALEAVRNINSCQEYFGDSNE